VCRLCVVVDVAGVGMAILQLTMVQKPIAAPNSRVRPLWLLAALGGLGLGALLGVGGASRLEENRPPPPEVTALWVPGKVNVVEVADFACPHCRRMHAVLTRFLAEEGDRVHVVRLTAPMPAHADARSASRAFLCASAQGKGDEMAEALFLTPALDPASCERIAASLQLSLPAFRACIAAPETEERLDNDLTWVKRASPHGLPVIWVQERMFFGLQPIEVLRTAARDARRQNDG
jgi:protein-disulfide isomerase